MLDEQDLPQPYVYLINVHDGDDMQWKLESAATKGYELGWKAAMDSIKPTVDALDNHIKNMGEALKGVDKALEPAPFMLPEVFSRFLPVLRWVFAILTGLVLFYSFYHV